ncbi:MAG TPA: hypothetical protein VKE74_21685 [Gemmataceae bacterium]|nr:hypothetical protein [Gemmataceae bacterium]
MIRIIGVPPGEAPDEVRAAWVGVELPLAPGEREPVNLPGLGVVSGEPTPAVGYVVDGPTAVDRLAAHNPGAAQWWRANAPQVLEPGATLVFAAEVCERVG